jgi:hypothetical protein
MCDNQLDLILLKHGGQTDAAEIAWEEGLLAHEFAHGSSAYSNCVIADSRVLMPRVGLSVGTHFSKNKGTFLEEAFADMVRGEYAKNFMPNPSRDSLIKQSRRPELGLDSEIKISTGYADIFIPSKYLFSSEENEKISYIYSSFAAYGLELLCKENPFLFSAIVKSRSDIESLRSVPKIIDNAYPGLYSELNKLRYEEEDFVKGLGLIIDNIHESKI